jgi:hypothetical protein
MISSITGFERLMMNRNKETQRLQALVDEQAEQIDSLLKTVEALVIACKQAATDEREACAVVCQAQMGLIPTQAWTVNPYSQCMKAIRARGEPNL